MKIRINNNEFVFFNNFAISRVLDSVASTFAFVARFNPANASHRELFRPLSYPKIEVFTDDDILQLTGTIVNSDFNSKDTPELVKLSGYSIGGVLEDCNIPYSAYPLESNSRSLRNISERLLNLFNLKLVIDPSVVNESNIIYPKSVAMPTETIKSYISKLAAQRNIVVSHNKAGDIIFFRPNLMAASKISFDQTNTVTMSLSVKGQFIHDEISVIRQPSSTNNNLSPVDTVKNNLVSGFRPKVKTLTSGTDTDTSRSADNELATELQNIIVTVVIPRFEDLDPGDIVEVQNNEIFLYNKTRLIIRSITLNQNEKKETMTLSLVLPESFTGSQPKQIF